MLRVASVFFGVLLVCGCSSGGGDAAAAMGSQPLATVTLGDASAPNQPPVVNAGKSQVAQGGGIVVLSGSAVDPEGGALSHRWRQVDGPGVTLNDADAPVANFETPAHIPNASLSFELEVTDANGMSSIDRTDVVVTTGYSPCAVTSPPTGLGIDSWFYQKYCDANGQPVLAPGVVPNEALDWVRYQALEMLKRLPVAAQAMISNEARIAIKGDEQVMTQIPEFSDLNALYPEYDWDLLPGVGAVMERPVTLTTEENVLCLDCHSRQSDDAVAAAIPLEYWDDVSRVAFSRSLEATPRESLMTSLHTHATSLAVLSLAVLALLWASRWPRGLLGALAGATGLALAVDLACQLLSREHEALVLGVAAGGALWGLAVGVALALVLLDLWLPAKEG